MKPFTGLTKSNIKMGFIMFLLVVSFSIPYCLLMVNIQKDVFNIDLQNWILSLIKFISYSTFAPLILLITLSLIKHYRLLAVLYSLLFTVLYFLAMFVILLYYKYFGTIPSLTILDPTKVGGVSDALLILSKQVYYQLLGIQEWLIIILLVFSILFTFIYLELSSTRRIKSSTKISLLILILAFYYGLHKVQVYKHGGEVFENWIGRNTEAVLYFGILPVYHQLLQYELFRERKLVPFPGKISKNNKREENMQRFKTANVLIIQVESLDSEAIDVSINGKLVMPFLHRFKERSIYFKNFFAQHSGGGSSDADLSMLTSLLPSAYHIGLYTADYERVKTLVEVLREHGYLAVAMSPVSLVFHDKMSSYPRIGFDYFYDSKFYQGEARGWYSKDWHFFDQSLKVIEELSQPFFAYLVTIQSHGPFRNYYDSTKRAFDFKNAKYSKTEIDYLLSIHEVDRALDYFFYKMLRTGILDNTIVLIYGDHVGHALSNKDCLADCIPLFIYHKRSTPRIESKVGSHLDIAPTIVDMLDIPEPDGWLGTSLFYSGENTVLFDDLSVIEADNDNMVLIKRRKNGYKSHLEYSNSIVE